MDKEEEYKDLEGAINPKSLGLARLVFGFACLRGARKGYIKGFDSSLATLICIICIFLIAI